MITVGYMTWRNYSIKNVCSNDSLNQVQYTIKISIKLYYTTNHSINQYSVSLIYNKKS